MTHPIAHTDTIATPSAYIAAPAPAMEGGGAVAASASAVANTVELSSPYPFASTLTRVAAALEGAGLTIFARVDHQAAAQAVGLAMPPTTVLIFGNPKGGTPLMVATPAIALDLPLRVLVREDAAGHTLVSYHPALTLTRAAGIPDAAAAGLSKSADIIAAAIQP